MKKAHSILTQLRPPTRVAAAMGLAFLVGCQKHTEGDGHDHGTAPQHADEHAGQDGHLVGGGPEEHTDEVTLTAEAIERYGVVVQAATLRTLQPTLTAPARVAFNTEAIAHIGSPLRGRAVDINVRLGDIVTRGDALLVVESPELGEAQHDYFQKQIIAETSSPAVDLARASWERAKGLLEHSQGISLTEVQKREAEYQAAVAAQRAAEAAAVGAKSRLHLLGMSFASIDELARIGTLAPRYTIQAPFDGQLIQCDVTLGELVSADRDALMVLADTSTLWVLADVPEARLHEVAIGAEARVTIGTAGAPPFDGRVAFVAPLVDAATRTARVRIEAPAAALTLRPGMFAQVEIACTDPTNLEPAPVVAVPDEAVQSVEGGPAVFVPVQGELHTFTPRAVTAGPSVGGLVPIYAGLLEGEEFVVAGTFILKAEIGKGSVAHEH
ncbi:MAG: efflux RND transporter periplasmic adaptor subunit [Phycisphaerales bacterium]|nr:efflux RND transporter periplasmic adaptor subunit [Phycisphaerales bacterium]